MSARNERAAAALERAAEYIEEHGWTRGTFERDGRVCVLGALSHVARTGTYDTAVNALREKVGTCWLAGWNDRQPYRGPVLRTLREVAADLRAGAL